MERKYQHIDLKVNEKDPLESIPEVLKRLRPEWESGQIDIEVCISCHDVYTHDTVLETTGVPVTGGPPIYKT